MFEAERAEWDKLNATQAALHKAEGRVTPRQQAMLDRMQAIDSPKIWRGTGADGDPEVVARGKASPAYKAQKKSRASLDGLRKAAK